MEVYNCISFTGDLATSQGWVYSSPNGWKECL